MRAGWGYIQRGALTSALSSQLCGCALGGYNTYTTPRTTPAGRIQTALFVQGAGFSGEVGGTSRRVMVPVAPSFGMRVGLARSVDIGARAALTLDTEEAGSGSGFGLDLRARILDGDAIELAFDPGVSVAQLPAIRVSDARGYSQKIGFSFWTFDAPLVTGINLDDSLALVLSTGVLYGLRKPDVEPDWAAVGGRWVQGFAPRVGLGLHDDSGGFGLHPEATLVFATRDGERRIIYTVGVALEWRRAKARPER